VWFGLRDVSTPTENASSPAPAVAESVAPIVATPLPKAAASPIPTTEPSALAPAPRDPATLVSSPPRPVSRKLTTPSAWVRDEHPKAWLK